MGFLSMKASPSPFPILAPISTIQLSCRAASVIPSPPPTFNFKTEILEISTATIAESHPQLLDLAKNGTLVLVTKPQYGAVPPWRSEFVEPDAIWLVGTTHVSQESASDVERVIRAVNPQNVVVELCRSRQVLGFNSAIDFIQLSSVENQQLRSTMFSLTGTGFFGAIGRSINLGGQTALALRLLLATFSSKLSSDINRPFGDEFRAARKVAEEIGAQLVLGDRPIEITLERAWNSLKWKEKLSLVSTILRGMTSSVKPVEEPTGGDSSFQLYEQLSLSYPSLLPPLIHERDTFLAWSLKRSKAVNKSVNVVGVIGKGHMNGVIYSLVSDTGNLRFRDLAGKKERGGWAASVARDLVRDTVIGGVLWLIYEHFKPVF
ncbi:hypothetical protein SASPL_151649 [Salvia splendens]|uniref:TraB domain-containing protein n=1 Tax=Salvia splendens TaxID=180675 RepID=A0A8X8Z3W1_SALSN|nr:hypothetical protein SASPL_151649 [Salvia splendens]